MYAGTDSTESQNYTQWALNPSAYQNMSNDQVDWAALAHQWIVMKETGPPIPPSHQIVAPPPPTISKPKKEMFIEGGEAPMDMENDDEVNKWNDGGSNDSFTWNQPPTRQQPPWGWNHPWPPPAGVPPPNTKTPLLPTPGGFNSYISGKDSPNNDNNYYNSSTTDADYNNSDDYWNSSAGSSKVHMKSHHKRYNKINIAVPAKQSLTLDAAKRKTLPAWIREGLEKMERDKIKHLDRVKDVPEQIEFEDKGKLRENAMEILKSTVKEVAKPEFNAYEDSDDDTDGKPLTSSPSTSPTPISYEQMMLKVRRTMTEILLKVTNREIQSICREELQRHVRKLKASNQHVSAPSGANLIAKLGLGAYEGSGDSSSESDEEEANPSYRDSDSELRDVIRRRKEEFSKTEKDIDHRLAEAARNDSRAGTPDSEIVSQVHAKVPDRKSRRSEELTPPPKTVVKSAQKPQQSSPSTLSDSDTDINSKSSKKSRRSRDARSSSPEKRSSKTNHSRSKTPKTKRHKSTYTRRSRSKTRSKRSRSVSRKRGSKKRSKYTRSKSRSRSRRSRSRSSRLRNKSRRRSDSRESYQKRNKRSRSRSRSRSYSRRSSRYSRRSRSYSSGRGKRSYRH